MIRSRTTRVFGVLLICLILSLFISPNMDDPLYVDVDPAGNYVLFGKFDTGSFEDNLTKLLVESLAHKYASYFNASIISGLPRHDVDTLIIIAHGANDGYRIASQLEGGTLWYADVPAKRAIYVSCAVGVIRQIDLDTEHFAYSLTDEADWLDGAFNVTGDLSINTYADLVDSVESVEIQGWGQYFLDLIKTGADWAHAEILARAMADAYLEV